MGLSNDIINQFVKTTLDKNEVNKENTVFGTTVISNGKPYVKIDGSEVITPIQTTTAVNDGDRVTVMIKDHTAILTGNITSPSMDKGSVSTEVSGKISEFGIIIADELYVQNGKIDNLVSENIYVKGELVANSAKIETLTAENVTINGKLEANEASIVSLEVGKLDAETAEILFAKIEDLTATNIQVNHLQGNFAEIETILAGNITSDNIHSSGITSDKLVIADGFIKDVMIENVNASKINAGEINTNNVKIQSENGGIVIADATQQFKDKDGNVRIQMGQDAAGEFNFTVFDKTGKGVLIDAEGVKEGAIADGLIKNDMIGDGEISGGKIDINSMINSVNNGTSTIKGSKVQLDTAGQTLEVAFNTLKTDVDNIEVGGRNLLKDTKDEVELPIYDTIGGYLVYKHWSWNDDIHFFKDVVGREITFSVDIISPNGNADLLVYTDNGNPRYYFPQQYLNITDSWKRYSFTTVIEDRGEGTNDWDTKIQFYCYNKVGVKVRKFKIELGNKPTDYTEAPEDTDSKIESNTTQLNIQSGKINTLIADTTIEKNGQTLKLKDEYSKLEQTVGGISTTVGVHESELSNIGTRVSTAETKIQQNSNAISLSATKTEVSTAINGITIGGSNLVANSTFNNSFNRWLADTHMGATVSNAGVGTNKSAMFSLSDSSQTIVAHQVLYGIEGGKEYTFSAWVSTEDVANFADNVIMSIYAVQFDSSNNYLTEGYMLGGSSFVAQGTTPFTKYSATSVMHPNTSWVRIYCYNRGFTGRVYYSQIQVERGNKATDWTPANSDVKDDLDAIQVGGRNLLLDSKLLGFSANNVGLGDSIQVADEHELYYRAIPHEGRHVSLFIFPKRAQSFNSGKEHVYSIMVRCPYDTTVSLWDNIHTNSYKETHIKANVWTRVESKPVPFTSFDGAIILESNATAYLDYKLVKQEEGTRATAWSPAVEDVENSIHGVDTKVETTKTEIAQLKVETNGITQRVESTENTITTVNAKVDGIQVGGVNLWKHTKEYDTTKYNGWIDNNDQGLPITDRAPHTHYNGFGVQRIAHPWLDITQRVPIEPYTNYTLSAYIKWEDEVGSLYFYCEGAINSGLQITDMVGTTEYKRVAVTFNSGGLAHSACRFECSSFIPYLICGLQLEKGNKPSDWSPAPSDVESSIGAVNAKIETTKTELGELKVETGRITQRVENTETSLTTVGNKLDGLHIGGTNLLKNGGFETGNLDYWHFEEWRNQGKVGCHFNFDNNSVHYGIGKYTPYMRATHVNSEDIGGLLVADINVVEGETYTISYYRQLWRGGMVHEHHYRNGSEFVAYLANHTSRVYDAAGRLTYPLTEHNHGDEFFHNSSYWKKVEITTTVPVGANVTNLRLQFNLIHSYADAFFFLDNVKVEKGEKATDYSPCPDDVSEEIIKSVSTAKAEILVETDRITQKVSNLEQTTSTIDGNVSNLSSRVSNAEQQITPSAIKNTVEQQINSNGSTVLATKSDVTQTSNDITFTFSNTGGYNHVRNGQFRAGLSYYWAHEYDFDGSGKHVGWITGGDWCLTGRHCLQITASHSTRGHYGVAQTITLKRGTTYTLSGYGASHRSEYYAYVQRNGGDYWVTGSTRGQIVGGTDDRNWDKWSFTFTTDGGGTDYNIHLATTNCADNGYTWFTDVQLEEGSVKTKYSTHPEELYNGSTTIDAGGVTIHNGSITIKDAKGNTALQGHPTDGLTVGNIHDVGMIGFGSLNGREIYLQRYGDARVALYNCGLSLLPAGWGNETLDVAMDTWIGGDLNVDGRLNAGTIRATSNGQSNNILVGDDCYLGDCNEAHTIRVMSASDNSKGRFKMGSGAIVEGGSNYLDLYAPHCSPHFTEKFEVYYGAPGAGSARFRVDNNTTYSYRDFRVNRIAGMAENTGNNVYVGGGAFRIEATYDDYARLYTSWQGYGDCGINIYPSGTTLFKSHSTTRHIMHDNGTKTGGTIEIEGTVYGMSPTDSPQTLIEYIEFDIDVDGETEIMLDAIYSKSITKYTVIPSNSDVKIVEKLSDRFIVTGNGVTDFVIKGLRIDGEQYYRIMGNFLHGEEGEVVI